MFETVMIILGAIVLGFFVWDIRNRSLAHKRAVQKAKDEIANLTHMTATVSSFADGKTNEVLLGISEDSDLFFYRLIIRGQLATQYTLHLPNILQASLLINGEKCNIPGSSKHKSPHMQATDFATQARQSLTPAICKSIRDITLEITFRSEDGTEKTLPVRLLKAASPSMESVIPRTFENSVWWQQYLHLLAQGHAIDKTEVD